MRIMLNFDRQTVLDAINCQNDNPIPMAMYLAELLLAPPGGSDRARSALRASYGIEVAEGGESVPLPTSVDEAKAMQLIAERYLTDNSWDYFSGEPRPKDKPEDKGKIIHG